LSSRQQSGAGRTAKATNREAGPPRRRRKLRERGFGILRSAIAELRTEAEAQERLHRDRLVGLHPAWSASARNLLHYLALRHRDIRALQEELAWRGLSSLGRSESHVLATIDAVSVALDLLEGRPPSIPRPEAIRFARGPRLLLDHARALLGRAPGGRTARIMVTLPSEAARDAAFVKALVAGGMDCARINCAHDDAVAWEAMIAHVRRASREVGRKCRIEMDLAGPKARTGSIDPHYQFVKWRPDRDRSGRVVSPVRVWLSSGELPATNERMASLRLPDALVHSLHKGDQIRFEDVRGKRRRLIVDSEGPGGRWASGEQTIYLRACSGIAIERRGSAGSWHSYQAAVGEPPPVSSYISLGVGDRLIVTTDGVPGRPARTDRLGHVIEPARISCTLPEAIQSVREGDPVWLDDGKIGGVVEDRNAAGISVRITSASRGGSKLRADKGINLPGSPLDLPALTPRDLLDLDFIVKHADLVGVSFVNRPADVAMLQEELRRRSGEHLGIVLKIETRLGFQHFPELLLASMRSASIGVMIARGDLAVECGYERLAEVQEEILWICEAAHVPVIWATQVLESLARTGQPSRAEVTDAAMGERAECVMLNKGPFLVEAVHALNDILCRMHAHQHKKSAMMRRLSVAALSNGSMVADRTVRSPAPE